MLHSGSLYPTHTTSAACKKSIPLWCASDLQFAMQTWCRFHWLRCPLSPCDMHQPFRSQCKLGADFIGWDALFQLQHQCVRRRHHLPARSGEMDQLVHWDAGVTAVCAAGASDGACQVPVRPNFRGDTLLLQHKPSFARCTVESVVIVFVIVFCWLLSSHFYSCHHVAVITRVPTILICSWTVVLSLRVPVLKRPVRSSKATSLGYASHGA